MAEVSPEIVELDPQEAVAVRGDVAIADLPQFFESAFAEAARAADVAGVEIVGPAFGFYPRMPTETVAVEAGFPVSASVASTGRAHPLVLPGGRAVRVTHVGSYETMKQTYSALEAWMSERGLRPAVEMWECYLSDPGEEPDPADWRTDIVWPIS